MPSTQENSYDQFVSPEPSSFYASHFRPDRCWSLCRYGRFFVCPGFPERATCFLQRLVFCNQGWTITDKSTRFADFAAFADVDANVLGAINQKLKEKTGKAADGYSDYRKILERDDIDAVMIATPDHWHTKISVEAMLAGKDVYCEKPLTLTIAEGKLIEKIVKQTGRVFQVGTMQRTENDQRFLKAIALIRAGRIGDIRKVTCGINGATGSPVIPAIDVPEGLDWDMWLGPAPKASYRALPELRTGYGGGVPLYTNCHYACAIGTSIQAVK